MDALFVLFLVVTPLVLFGLLADSQGVDSRDTFFDDHHL